MKYIFSLAFLFTLLFTTISHAKLRANTWEFNNGKWMQNPVFQDPSVNPPLTKHKPRKHDFKVDLKKDGSFSRDSKPLDAKKLTTLCKKQHAKDPLCSLILQGEEGTPFKHVRHVIRAAADGGVNRVKFTPFSHIPGLKAKEDDLKMALPAAPKPKKPPALQPLLIRIDQTGAVFTVTGKKTEALDKDPADKKLPKLNQHLAQLVQAAKAAGEKPIVQIHADPKAQQQRVIDVLNTLASHQVSKVTFADLVDE